MMAKKRERRRTIYEDFDPQSPETTEFRRIFTRVARANHERRVRTLLFTSAEGGEGKTTSAAYFSLVSALHQGLRTCLIDGDLHRPRIHRLFELPREVGLSEILGKGLPIEAGLKKCRYEKLSLLTAGEESESPSELLMPDRLSAMLERMKLLFDFIVVDSPPLLPVSDPVVLAREMDGVALVLRAGKTQRDVALRARRLLEGAGANLLGVIVNNVDDVLPYYFGHTYYRYPERRKAKTPGGETSSGLREPVEPAADGKRTERRAVRARAAGSSG